MKKSPSQMAADPEFNREVAKLLDEMLASGDPNQWLRDNPGAHLGFRGWIRRTLAEPKQGRWQDRELSVTLP